MVSIGISGPGVYFPRLLIPVGHGRCCMEILDCAGFDDIGKVHSVVEGLAEELAGTWNPEPSPLTGEALEAIGWFREQEPDKDIRPLNCYVDAVEGTRLHGPSVVPPVAVRRFVVDECQLVEAGSLAADTDCSGWEL